MPISCPDPEYPPPCLPGDILDLETGCCVPSPSPPTYICVDGVCVDPGDGSGDPSLSACENSGCGATDAPPCPDPALAIALATQEAGVRFVDEYVWARLPARWQCLLDDDRYVWTELDNGCGLPAPTSPGTTAPGRCLASELGQIHAALCPLSRYPAYELPTGQDELRDPEQALMRLIDFRQIKAGDPRFNLSDEIDTYWLNPPCASWPLPSEITGLLVTGATAYEPHFVEQGFCPQGISALLRLRVYATQFCPRLQCDEGPPVTFVETYALYDGSGWDFDLAGLKIRVTVTGAKTLHAELVAGTCDDGLAVIPEGGQPAMTSDYPLRAQMSVVAAAGCCGCWGGAPDNEVASSTISLAIEGFRDRKQMIRRDGQTLAPDTGKLIDVYKPLAEYCPPSPCQKRSCCTDRLPCVMVADITALDSCTCFDGMSIELTATGDPSGNAWQKNTISTCSQEANCKLICLCNGNRRANFWWNFDALNCSGYHQDAGQNVDCGGGNGRLFSLDFTATLTCGAGGCDGSFYPCACAAGSYRYRITIHPKT